MTTTKTTPEAFAAPIRTAALSILDERGSLGLTSKEFAKKVNRVGGAASGALSLLHGKGVVALLAEEKRGGCRPYVLPAYIHGRSLAPRTQNKTLKARAEGLHMAAGEIRSEARWQTEQQMRGNNVMTREECIKRLVMVEHILREMADRMLDD